jgi:hypothetical protein
MSRLGEAYDAHTPPLPRSRASSVNEKRHGVKLQGVAGTYEFFKKSVLMRRFTEINSVAKLLLQLEYFRRMNAELGFQSVKDCVTHMQYEYSTQGKVSHT